MTSLAEIRAKLQQQESKQNGKKGGYDNAIYPHWNTPENETSTIRFISDGDTTNDFFWRERQMINIQFSGIKGHDEGKPVTVKVPCVEMWDGQKCPIHQEIRPWFKDPSMEDMARKYWKKKSYLYQGTVVHSAFTEEEAPENIVRRFIISTQIHNVIKSALMDPDFGDHMPTEYDMGVDFRVTKTKKGQYADYSTSSWARKSRSLDQAERDGIAEHGHFDLNESMPKMPNQEELQVIFNMFESSVDGELYDPERFADFYRPYGFESPTSGASNRASHATTPTAQPAKTSSVSSAPESSPTDQDQDQDQDKDETVSTVSTPASGPKDAKDILAAIRARKDG